MKETLYLNNDLAIVNFSAGYATTGDQLLNSSTFSNYVHNFIDYPCRRHTPLSVPHSAATKPFGLSLR